MTIIREFLNVGPVVLEVAAALIPLMLVFGFFQIYYLKLPKSYLINLFKGVILTFLGLTFFLQGVNVGFLSVSREMGIKLGTYQYPWVLVLIGFVLGFTATFAEPAVRILGEEIEERSSGFLKKSVIIYTLSISVGFFVALGFARVIWGIPLGYIVIPCYILALILTFVSDPMFVGIAFDSGAVTTGPMNITFVMSMAIGMASTIDGRSEIQDGFGLIALVALAPILAMLFLGLSFKFAARRKNK